MRGPVGQFVGLRVGQILVARPDPGPHGLEEFERFPSLLRVAQGVQVRCPQDDKRRLPAVLQNDFVALGDPVEEFR